MKIKKKWPWGSYCGSVGRDPGFEFSHWQTFIEHLFTVNCVEKTKIKKKRPEIAHLEKKKSPEMAQMKQLGCVKTKELHT